MSRPGDIESAPIIFGKPVNAAWLIPVPACGSHAVPGEGIRGDFPGARIGRVLVDPGLTVFRHAPFAAHASSIPGTSIIQTKRVQD